MSDFLHSLHTMVQAAFVLLYLALLVGCLATLGRHRRASLFGLAGTTVLGVAQVGSMFTYWAIGWAQGAGHLSFDQIGTITTLYAVVGLCDTVSHAVGIVLLGYAAFTGRQSWYEAELATPLPGSER